MARHPACSLKDAWSGRWRASSSRKRFAQPPRLTCRRRISCSPLGSMKSASAGRTSGPHRRFCSRHEKHGRTLRERIPATASGSPKRLKLEVSIPRAKDWVTAILSGDLRACASSRSRMHGGRSMERAASAASHGYSRYTRAHARVTRLIQTGGTRGTAGCFARAAAGQGEDLTIIRTVVDPKPEPLP